MSGGREVAAGAVDVIDGLVAEMIDGGFPDNWIALGTILIEGREAQIQLKLTTAPAEFYEE